MLFRSDFAVREDGRPRDLDYFAGESKSEMPVLVILLIDTSTSQSQVLSKERHIATRFLERVFRPGDQAAVVTFDSNVYVLQSATSDLALLGRALEHIQPFAPGFSSELPPAQQPNGTRTCAAAAWAADWQASLPGDRKVIILISDAVDLELDLKLKFALGTALQNDVMIYAIRILDANAYAGEDGSRVRAGERALRLLASETGGLFFNGNNPRFLEAAFTEIAAEVRGQYSLGFVPQYLTYNTRFHSIAVAVKQKGTKVRARRGYYSPSPR